MVKKILHNARYFTFLLLVIFLGCELFLRIFISENMIVHHYPLIYAPDTAVGFKGIPGKEGYIRRPSIEKKFKLNNFGLYGPDFKADHPDSIFRILVFGTSVVEGIWAMQKDSYPAMLDKLFKEKGYRVEVIDCGISGNCRDLQNIGLMREYSAKFHADLVLFEHPIPIQTINYFREAYEGYALLFTGNNSTEWQHSETLAKRKVEMLKDNRFATDLYDLCFCARYWTRSHLDEWGTITHLWKAYADNACDNWQYCISRNYSVGESIDMFNGLEDSLNKINCRLVLFEYGNDEMTERMRHSMEVKFPYLSLAVPLDQKKYMHALDDHPNYLGFKVTAEKLFAELSRQYIPPAYQPDVHHQTLADRYSVAVAGSSKSDRP